MSKLYNLNQISFPDFAATLMHHSIEAGNKAPCTSLGSVVTYFSSWVMPTAYSATGATASVAGAIFFGAGTFGVGAFWAIGCFAGVVDWASTYVYKINLSEPFPEFEGVKATARRCGDHVIGIFIFTFGTLLSEWSVGCAEKWNLAPGVIDARKPKLDPIAQQFRQLKEQLEAQAQLITENEAKAAEQAQQTQLATATLTSRLNTIEAVVHASTTALNKQDAIIQQQAATILALQTQLSGIQTRLNEAEAKLNALPKMQAQLNELPDTSKDLDDYIFTNMRFNIKNTKTTNPFRTELIFLIETVVTGIINNQIFLKPFMQVINKEVCGMIATALDSEKEVKRLINEDVWAVAGAEPLASPALQVTYSKALVKSSTAGLLEKLPDPSNLVSLSLPLGLWQILKTVVEQPILIPAGVMRDLQTAPQETIQKIYALFLAQVAQQNLKNFPPLLKSSDQKEEESY
jgi:hypothetical protein